MATRTSEGPELVIVLSDGIRGHENQSEGVAWWLGELCGADVKWFRIPCIEGLRRFWWYKIRIFSLKQNTDKSAGNWVGKIPEGNAFISELESIIAAENIAVTDVLFLSAGSSTAPWCLSVARVLGSKCCTIMTPSVIGTDPFDFAVVPKHDHPKPASNVFVTLGAPNMIRPDLLESEAKKLVEKYPPRRNVRWAVLLGGDDANYRLTPEWVKREIPKILAEAQKTDADVYITTSRRTSPEAEEAITNSTKNHENVRALILASREPWNPVPGMLGLCDCVYCTEDSVSMISEATTAGCEVRVLAMDRAYGVRFLLQYITVQIVNAGLISQRFLWGIPKFDVMISEIVENTSFTSSQLETAAAVKWLSDRWTR